MPRTTIKTKLLSLMLPNNYQYNLKDETSEANVRQNFKCLRKIHTFV